MKFVSSLNFVLMMMSNWRTWTKLDGTGLLKWTVLVCALIFVFGLWQGPFEMPLGCILFILTNLATLCLRNW